jgi:hypothetical protein
MSVMTTEVIARVDAWMVGRTPTALSRRWSTLVSLWWYEREKWPDDVHATEAAMRGILLALVRVGWSDPSLTVAQGVGGWLPSGRVADTRGLYGYISEDEALVATLEAAP